jgi:[ribosomal protein S5]-alanine N-acetyltransferase
LQPNKPVDWRLAPKPQILTPRLRLRAFAPDRDINHYLAIRSNAEVLRYLKQTPEIDAEILRQSLTLRSFALTKNPRPMTAFGVESQQDGVLVGEISVGRHDQNAEFGYLGFLFAPQFWGQGFATEAALAMLKFAFENDAYKLVIAGVSSENIACQKVLAKIGMRQIVPEDNFPGAPDGTQVLAFALSQRCWQRRENGSSAATAWRAKAVPGSFQDATEPYAEIYACLMSEHCSFCLKGADTTQLWVSARAAICGDCVASIAGKIGAA